jgi:Fe-S cluster assembly ATP-binding protein
MLKIKNITAAIKDISVLNDVSIEVKGGEIHAIMGQKQSGKSSLVHAILGNPILDIKGGSMTFKRKSLLKKNIEERNLLGIYTTFQFLPTLDGITNFELAKVMLKTHNDTRNSNAVEKEYKALVKKLGLSSNHGHKSVNDETMSNTECKKNELLHMMLLDPEIIILDELDKGIEEDELEPFASHIKNFLSNNKKSAIVVTHSKEFLDALKPTHVHIMVGGTITTQGTAELYKRIVKDGYSQFS